MFFAEIVILWSADAFESFIHDVPDTTSFWPSWSGGRECEYGADIDRRTTGPHSSSVTPDQSHHHHPFHTPSPLCSCPSLCMACEAAQMPSDSGRLSVGSRRRCLPADQSKLAGRSLARATSAGCGRHVSDLSTSSNFKRGLPVVCGRRRRLGGRTGGN